MVVVLVWQNAIAVNLLCKCHSVFDEVKLERVERCCTRRGMGGGEAIVHVPPIRPNAAFSFEAYGLLEACFSAGQTAEKGQSVFSSPSKTKLFSSVWNLHFVWRETAASFLDYAQMPVSLSLHTLLKKKFLTSFLWGLWALRFVRQKILIWYTFSGN